MEKYVGLDVSMEETSVCVLDGSGNIVFEGKTSSHRTPCRNFFAQRHPTLRASYLKPAH
jgi:hypothetical protein